MVTSISMLFVIYFDRLIILIHLDNKQLRFLVMTKLMIHIRIFKSTNAIVLKKKKKMPSSELSRVHSHAVYNTLSPSGEYFSFFSFLLLFLIVRNPPYDQLMGKNLGTIVHSSILGHLTWGRGWGAWNFVFLARGDYDCAIPQWLLFRNWWICSNPITLETQDSKHACKGIGCMLINKTIIKALAHDMPVCKLRTVK